MTEEEAKTKWCPQTRINDGWNRTSNTADDYEKGLGAEMTTSCIASDCMMWVRQRRVVTESVTEVMGGYCGMVNNGNN